jgi:hypothetical protein
VIVYLFNRWIMARRFEPAGAGYVWRRRPDLPGIAVSAAERQETFRAFRRRYWRHVLWLYGGLIAVMAVAGLAVAILGFDDRIAMPIGYMVAAILMVVILRAQRSWARLPETLFADRPPVAATEPTGTWWQRYAALARRRSWLVHAALVAVYGMITGLLVPRASGADLGHWLMFVAFAASFVMVVVGAILKARRA